MHVPLLDTKAQNLPLEPELTEAFVRVLRSGSYILGGEVTAFEGAVRDLTGARHTLGVSSGTDALLLALMALGIGPGDEVICPAFTFFATAGCVHRVGATPVFADARADSFNLDVDSAAALVTPRTRAIIPVHLFGQSADMDGILALAEKHGLAVIEDAAQSLGATHRGRQSGTLGTFGTYSFFPSKNLGGLGDAGMLVTNDDALAEKAAILRVHGSHPKYYHRYVGGNFRIDALQSALLAVKLRQFPAYNAARQRNAARYLRGLSALDGVGSRLLLPGALEGNGHIWNQFTLRVPGGGRRRDALRAHLAEAGVMAEIYYPLTLDRQECFADVPPTGIPPTIAHRLADEVLSIPVYPELESAQLDHVIAVLGSWLAAAGMEEGE